jgi:hypothetical protein
MTDDFPAIAPSRPVWLMTLADLALLLVGFLVLTQATQPAARSALAQGIREGFGAAQPAAAMPVAATTLTFASASAAAQGEAALAAWARDALRDPRVTLTITGATDGSAVDIDPATGSPLVLAADRARVAAAVLAKVAPPARLSLTTTTRPTGRVATITLAFAGERR